MSPSSAAGDGRIAAPESRTAASSRAAKTAYGSQSVATTLPYSNHASASESATQHAAGTSAR